MLKQTIKIPSEWWLSADIQEILWDYSEWLHKKGYIDTDFYTEEPHAVDAYLEEKSLKNK